MLNPIIILGIDPGYERLGVAIVEKINNKETLLFSTCIKKSSSTSFPNRLKHLGNKL